jgi:hypothetical protein
MPVRTEAARFIWRRGRRTERGAAMPEPIFLAAVFAMAWLSGSLFAPVDTTPDIEAGDGKARDVATRFPAQRHLQRCPVRKRR